jgi:hypothetical protein
VAAVWFSLLAFIAALTARRGIAPLIGVCFVLSIFQAAAAIAVGGFFLQPAFTFLLMIVALIGWRCLGQDEIRWLFQAARLNFIVILFTSYCLLSAIVFPRVFGGNIIVFPLQSSEFPGQELARYYLRPEPTNFNQSVYAVLSLLACLAATYAVLRDGTLVPIRRAAVVSVTILVVLGFIQWTVRFAGMTFKPALLYNNTGVALLLDQNFSGVPRINVTFIEPSSLAIGLAPLVAYLLTIAIIDHRARIVAALGLAGGLILILSTSTTAYLGLTVACISVVATLAIHNRALFLPSALLLTGSGLLVCALLGLAIWMLVPALHDSVMTVFSATVTDKGASLSAIERGTWNQQAWHNFLQTYGLGTGYGSSRASGLVYVLLGTTGLPGFALFLAMAGQAILPGRHDDGVWCADLAGMKAGVMTAAVTLIISGAELTWLPFWLMIGTLAANRAAAAPQEYVRVPLPYAAEIPGQPDRPPTAA